MGEEKPAEIPIEAQPQGHFDDLATDIDLIGLSGKSKQYKTRGRIRCE